MIELRLCSINAAIWLDSIRSSPIPAPPMPRNLGLMFERAIARVTSTHDNSTGLAGASPVGLVVAQDGPRFDELALASSIHLLVCATIGSQLAEDDIATTLINFIEATPESGTVPKCLNELGARNYMRRSDVGRCACWINGVDRQVFAEEVASAIAPKAVADYVSLINSLARVFDFADRVHQCDVCCIG